MASKFEKRIKNARPLPFLTRFLTGPADSMPSKRIVEYQKAALKEMVTQAYKNSPFYQEKMKKIGVKPQDIKGLADLAKMPFTTKDELRGNPWALLACPKKDISLVYVSTGTTGGEEIYIMYSWKDLYLHDLAPEYPNLFDIDPGDICFNALPKLKQVYQMFQRIRGIGITLFGEHRLSQKVNFLLTPL